MVKLSRSFRWRKSLLLVLPLLVAVSLACSFPVISQETPSPTAPSPIPEEIGTPLPTLLPTPTPQPLPPQLIEVDPPLGSNLPVNGSITLYFNQPMDHASVTAAFSGPPGHLDWQDEATLIWSSEETLAPSAEITLSLDPGAQAANGLSFSSPVDLSYQVVGYLRLIDRLPQPTSEGTDPTSAVVATFNLPVVPLGAAPDSLPPAFTLSPGAEGQGEWVNTSTYIFYPQPAFAGGTEYTVSLTPDLVSAGGGPLKNIESWSFRTASPDLVSIQPEPGADNLSLDTSFVMTFNQPMDPDSFAGDFALVSTAGEVLPGDLAWNQDLTTVTFSPQNMLRRGQDYQIVVDPQAQSIGGTALGQEIQASYRAVQPLRVVSSEPFQGGRRSVFAGVVIHFNAPIKSKDTLQFVTFDPEVPNLQAFVDEDQRTLRLFGDFAPETNYTLILSPNLPDKWNGRLSQEFNLNFETLPLDPDLIVTLGSDVLFLTPQESRINAQVTNLSEVSISLGSLSTETFINLLGPNAYNQRLNYRSADQRTYQQPLSLQSNRSQPVDIPLSLGSGPLLPGLYYLRFNFDSDRIFPGPFMLVVSNIQLTFKLSATDALVWALDLRTGGPIEDAPLTLFGEGGSVLARGRTDENGVLKTGVSNLGDVYSTSYAVLGQPGDENFAMALSTWSQGIEGWNFGIPTDYSPPHLEAYIYTDRPIYRPGQTVYFRAIARQAYNGRYSLPRQSNLTWTVFNDLGERVDGFDLDLSDYGTANGAYVIPAGTPPGTYNLTVEGAGFSSVSFQVAEYRKPEIDLSVSFSQAQALGGENLHASVETRYFFDAPVGNLPVHWRLFKRSTPFNFPDYQVGIQDLNWLVPLPGGGPSFGELVSEEDATMGPDGKLTLDLPTSSGDVRQHYTLEVTTQDESGLPVSARASVQVNPAEFYIGVRPDTWVGQASKASEFEVLVIDWDRNPAGSRALRADFKKVVWEREDPDPNNPFSYPTFTPQYTLIGSTDFVTGESGVARLAFTPPEPGTYQLDVHGLHPGEENAHTQVMIWIGGEGQAIWPNLPNQQVRLTADHEKYLPGETAQVFIPNPFEGGALALITVERGVILRYQIEDINGTGENIRLPLSDEDSPNVFVSVTMMEKGAKGVPDFRQGYATISVEPVEHTLNVELVSQPRRTGPGESVMFDVRVTDQANRPVDGEFSLALVDKAVLALSDPNSEEILPAFYDRQPLGVRTGLALAAYTHRQEITPEGGGGGGGGEFLEPLVIREEFLDTAFWDANIVTDANGEAQVKVDLPDNLTTWQADLRLVTLDTRVGQSRTQVVATRDLIIRPVTPRFLVQGDHAQLSAVVNNNTDRPLTVDVSLQSTGFDLDQDSPSQQRVSVPSGGNSRVNWWGTALDAGEVDLVFSASSGDLKDAAQPERGPLPILRYSAPQTYATSGVLDEAGQRLEVVSLPRSFDVQGGVLDLELAPSLGAAMVDSLEVLENFPFACTEQILSRFLPNLAAFRVVQDFGLEAPGLQARLDRTVDEGLNQLRARQNGDGGWGWWSGDDSDPYVTSYVLFGLIHARDAGIPIDDQLVQPAVDFLIAGLPAPEMLTEVWQMDRLAFEYFVLSQVDSANPAGVTALFEQRARLNPWAQALLGLAIRNLSVQDDRLRTLMSDLESQALRSATGAHWEDQSPSFQNMSSPIFASAVVLYALAQQDPASPLVAEGVRYLMAHRGATGSWASTYETAWTLMALTEVIQSTGELGGGFEFSALLNGTPLASGEAGGANQLLPVQARVPVSELQPHSPNALLIERGSGPGRLYYNAHLRIDRPVEDAMPLDSGIHLSRAYYPAGGACPAGECPVIHRARTGDLVEVRLTVTLPDAAYYLLVEDMIPAGTEVLDTSLKTSQKGAVEVNPKDPFREGWGWWYFDAPQVRDDRVAWAVDSLPPGTYQLSYTLVVLHPGQYRLLPARAWQFYFPEVQGTSAGDEFVIED